MKRMGAILLAVLLIVPCAYSATNQVLSRNAVGYIRLVIPRGKLALVRMDFEDLGGDALLADDVFGEQLPLGSKIYTYEPGVGYVLDNLGFSGWSTNIIFDRGKGFWISVPTTALSNEYAVYLMGEVPDTLTAPTTTVDIVNGITQVGYSYPANVYWTNTALARQAQLGDALYWWDGTNYVLNNYTFAGWADTNLVITPGMGFWFLTNVDTNWMETKPYTWP